MLIPLEIDDVMDIPPAGLIGPQRLHLDYPHR